MVDNYVYIIAHEKDGTLVGPVKIGISSDPQKRLASLQIGNPAPLRIFKMLRAFNKEISSFIERGFHYHQKKNRMAGEWFNISPERALNLMMLDFVSFFFLLGHEEEKTKELMRYVGFESYSEEKNKEAA